MNEDVCSFVSEEICLGVGLEFVRFRDGPSIFTDILAKTLRVEVDMPERVTLHFDEIAHVHLSKEQAKKLASILLEGIDIIENDFYGEF